MLLSSADSGYAHFIAIDTQPIMTGHSHVTAFGHHIFSLKLTVYGILKGLPTIILESTECMYYLPPVPGSSGLSPASCFHRELHHHH